MKTSISIIVLLLARLSGIACPACTAQQPRLLRGITHGAGPDSRWDYIIVCGAVIITLLTFYYSLKWLIRPGESAPDHIKQRILNRQ